jgi:hypothetical protein
VLAILARKLGSATTVAIDNDEWAYRNALDNIRLNDENEIIVELGDASSLNNRQFDVILANINRNILLRDMKEYVKCLVDGGKIFFSGFYEEDLVLIKKEAERLGLTIPEVITLASIVEEETNYQPEKSRVAGLYLNRLRKGIRLQSDPTVKYALKDFKLNRILFEHLKVDDPYNTYKYAGLPPGPIRLPSIATIDAVLNAEKHNYIYMCAHPDFNGTHNFAVTLAEHNRNAAKYHVALRKWLADKKKK